MDYIVLLLFLPYYLLRNEKDYNNTVVRDNINPYIDFYFGT
jgi:hypothetical protein